MWRRDNRGFYRFVVDTHMQRRDGGKYGYYSLQNLIVKVDFAV